MRCLEGTDSALGEKQMQTEKEGNLSFAEAIIKPGLKMICGTRDRFVN